MAMADYTMLNQYICVFDKTVKGTPVCASTDEVGLWIAETFCIESVTDRYSAKTFYLTDEQVAFLKLKYA